MLPPDQELCRYRILLRRSRATHEKAVKELESARREYEAIAKKFYDRCVELGYCSRCELSLNQCKGHIGFAAPKEQILHGKSKMIETKEMK